MRDKENLKKFQKFSFDSEFKTKLSLWSTGTYVFFNTILFPIPLSKISS